MGENPFVELSHEFAKAPPAGKALAISALVVVAGLGLYVAHNKAGQSTGSTASGATSPGIDASTVGGDSSIPFANMPASGSTAASSAGSNTLSNIAQTFKPAAKGVSGYEDAGKANFFNNGSLQGAAAIGDTTNLSKTTMPAGFKALASGVSGYESNGYGVYYNNGSVQSVVKLPTSTTTTPTPVIPKAPILSTPVVNPFKPHAKGVSGYESGGKAFFYNNGSLQGSANVGDTSLLSKTVKPKTFKPLAKGVSGYESNGYGVYYNNGNVQSVVKLPVSKVVK